MKWGKRELGEGEISLFADQFPWSLLKRGDEVNNGEDTEVREEQFF